MDAAASAPATKIEFRPGRGLGATLGRRAGRWGVSEHIAAKRLATLAAHGLVAADHGAILRIMEQVDIGFGPACAVLAARRR